MEARHIIKAANVESCVPGEFPSALSGAMPDVVASSKILNDPILMAMFKDTNVMASLRDAKKIIANLAKHQAHP